MAIISSHIINNTNRAGPPKVFFTQAIMDNTDEWETFYLIPLTENLIDLVVRKSEVLKLCMPGNYSHPMLSQ